MEKPPRVSPEKDYAELIKDTKEAIKKTKALIEDSKVAIEQNNTLKDISLEQIKQSKELIEKINKK